MGKTTVKIIFLIVLAVFMYTGCDKNDSDSNSDSSESGYFVPTDVDTAYCLMCHVSYENLARQTAVDSETGLERDYGWDNPHDSFHGGPIPCMSCHGDGWMPLASVEGTCNDGLRIARLSLACVSCHEPQEKYTPADKYPSWDYTKP